MIHFAPTPCNYCPPDLADDHRPGGGLRVPEAAIVEIEQGAR